MRRKLTPDWQRSHAKRLRREMTPAERHLWKHIRAHRLGGLSFRRQVPMGPYIADFVCHRARLVVEVDGGQHANREQDRSRDAWFRAQGYEVLRFWNHDVLERTDAVLQRILEHASLTSERTPPPYPSPLPGEGTAPRPVAPLASGTEGPEKP